MVTQEIVDLLKRVRSPPAAPTNLFPDHKFFFMSENHRIILCLVGLPTAGKDTASRYLTEKYGFQHLSTGDLVRNYLAEHNLGEATRDLLQQAANQLRAEKGSDYLVKLSLENPAARLVITGIRATAEAEAVKKAGGKIMVISVPFERRYQRALLRNRVGEGSITKEEFRQKEITESSNTDSNKQNLLGVIKMADYQLTNAGSLEKFHQEIDNLMLELRISPE